MGFRSLDDADVTGKRVLVRVDLNVPMHAGKVADATRIHEIAPTITELADKGGKVILLSHLNRPQGPDPKDSLRPVAAEVARIVKRPVAFAEDCVGPKAQEAVAAMKDGDILCLENTRFHPEEEKNDKTFAKQLAALGDIFVEEAFSAAHRAHASITGIVTEGKLPAYPGRAMKAELDALAKAFETPEHPIAAIVGGAKISSKLDLLDHLLGKVETLIIGGGMANTFFAAQGKRIGKSLTEKELVPQARDILAKAAALGREIVLPVDAVVAEKLADNMPTRVVDIDAVGSDDMILDIGPRSIEHVVSVLARSKTLVWNGPFGAFEVEPFDNGTTEIAEAVAELTKAEKLVSFAGGGDTVAALNIAGVMGRLTHVSTAGGAFLESLEGKTLPGVEVLTFDTAVGAGNNNLSATDEVMKSKAEAHGHGTLQITPTIYPETPEGQIIVQNYLTINVNNVEFKEFTSIVGQLLHELRTSRPNVISSEVRSKLAAELGAGLIILNSPKPDPKMVKLLLHRPLLYIADKAGAAIIATLAVSALMLLGKITGLH